MLAIHHFLTNFGMIGTVFFATASSSAQCTEQWLPGEGIPGLSGAVYATAVYDDGSGPALYVGGSFTVAGEVLANNIAKWEPGAPGSWSPLGSRIGGVSSPQVHTLIVYNGELIAAGNFTTAGWTQANFIARWDGTNWSPLGSGMNDLVQTLSEYNGELIAGGWFTSAGGMEANRIARWDGASWSPLASGMNSGVMALTEYNGNLITGGFFTTAGGMEANRIARWDGTSWSPLDSGMNSIVKALTEYNGELIAGGNFTSAGGHVSAYWARWGLGPLLGDLDGDCIVGMADLTVLLDNWGPCPPPEKGECPADLNGDGVVNTIDLLILFANWG